MKTTTQRLSLALSVLAFASLPVLAGNIVLNGNFGTGDLTDWTVNTSSDHPWNIQSTGGLGGDPYPGDTFYASTGCVGAPCITGTAGQQASLSQTLADTSGTMYTLSFEFGTDLNDTPNELDVLWDGTSILDLGPGGTLGPIANYQLYTVTNLLGTGSDTLTFLGRQDPSYNALDNVCVSSDTTCGSVSGVPEPSTLWLAGGALLALGLIRLRTA